MSSCIAFLPLFRSFKQAKLTNLLVSLFFVTKHSKKCIKPIDDSAKKIKITGNDDDYTPTIKIKVPKVIKKRKK